MAKDGVWIGLRNGLAATGIGLGGLYVYSSFISPHRDDDWDNWDDFGDEYEPSEGQPRQAPPY